MISFLIAFENFYVILPSVREGLVPVLCISFLILESILTLSQIGTVN